MLAQYRLFAPEVHSVSNQLSTITNYRPLLRTTIIRKFPKFYGSFRYMRFRDPIFWAGVVVFSAANRGT